MIAEREARSDVAQKWYKVDQLHDRAHYRVLCHPKLLDENTRLSCMDYINANSVEDGEVAISKEMQTFLEERLDELFEASNISQFEPFTDGVTCIKPRFRNGSGFTDWHIDGDHDGDVVLDIDHEDLGFVCVVFLENASSNSCLDTRTNYTFNTRLHELTPLLCKQEVVVCNVPEAGSASLHASTVAHCAPSGNCGWRLVVSVDPE